MLIDRLLFNHRTIRPTTCGCSHGNGTGYLHSPRRGYPIYDTIHQNYYIPDIYMSGYRQRSVSIPIGTCRRSRSWACHASICLDSSSRGSSPAIMMILSIFSEFSLMHGTQRNRRPVTAFVLSSRGTQSVRISWHWSQRILTGNGSPKIVVLIDLSLVEEINLQATIART